MQDDIYVTRSALPPLEEYLAEIRPLWESHILTNRGDLHKAFEDAVQDYLGVDHCTLFVNGHSALECVLECLRLGLDGRDEVITTPYTFASTTHAIVRKGLTPVFCDITPDDFTLDVSKLEALITDKTCAVLPVHVYGNICDVDAIQEIADRHELKVVYDAAHAFGVRKGGVGVGNFGDASMFSFHATKVFNTIEGGAVVHPDGALSEQLSQWRNFGITGPETVEYAGGNSKMNEFAAAMGLCNLRHVDGWITARQDVAERYCERLERTPGLKLYTAPADVEPNYGYMPVIVDPEVFGATRDDVFSTLARSGVHARKYFYPLTSDFACYRDVLDPGDTPVARRVAARIITLPIYPELAVADVDYICDVVLGCAR